MRLFVLRNVSGCVGKCISLRWCVRAQILFLFSLFEQGDAAWRVPSVSRRCTEILRYNYSDTSCDAKWRSARCFETLPAAKVKKWVLVCVENVGNIYLQWVKMTRIQERAVSQVFHIFHIPHFPHLLFLTLKQRYIVIYLWTIKFNFVNPESALCGKCGNVECGRKIFTD